ncbi:hypothetical protein, partial [uncultured Rummeliibacillus sp.]|uniref:hypothetical protein n=1 Tax=uncultured Rummeliibacillus sp. TaxID=762292 RepID=UPI0026215C08
IRRQLAFFVLNFIYTTKKRKFFSALVFAKGIFCDEASEAMQEHTVFSDEEIEAKPAESAIWNGTQKIILR